jgi:hypothetical protein
VLPVKPIGLSLLKGAILRSRDIEMRRSPMFRRASASGGCMTEVLANMLALIVICTVICILCVQVEEIEDVLTDHPRHELKPMHRV